MRSVVVFLAFVGPMGLFAQISHGGAPYGWGLGLPVEAVPVSVQLDPLSEDELLPVSAETERAPFRYGTQRFVSVDVLAEGSWITLPDDRRVCRVAITSPGAAMLSVQFDRFDLAPEARVYLYDAARSRYIGGFTHENHLPTGDLATAVVPGDAVVIVNGTNDDDADAGAPPAGEPVESAIDNVTQKYLNFLDLGSGLIAGRLGGFG